MRGPSIPSFLKRRRLLFVATAIVTVLVTSSLAATGGAVSASTNGPGASGNTATRLLPVTPRVVHPSGGVGQPSVGGPQDLDAEPPPNMQGGTPTTGLPPVIGDFFQNPDINVNTNASLVTPLIATGNFGGLASFTGATFANTCTLSGGSCNGSEPPDTQMAAGATEIVEDVNNNAFVYNRSGTLLNSYALTAIFQPPGQSVGLTDPKILFDPTTSRFYATEMVCQNAACGASTWTHMGISFAESSDPATGWSVYDYLNDGMDLQDQEKLGFSGDKITIAVNEYGCKCGAGSMFKQENVIVIQKSDAVVAATITPVIFNDSSGSTYRFDSMPTTPLNASTSDNNQYVVWDGNQTSNNTMEVVRITGTPNANNVDFTSNTTSLGIANQTAPPTPVAKGGNLAGDKQNLQSAMVQGNDLWAVATDGCTPQYPNPDTTTRDCTRLVEVDLGTNNVVTDTDVGTDGTYRINPSVTKDSAGHVFFGFTISDATTYATAALDASAVPLSAVLQRINFDSGDVAYGGGRWGDYSGTQQDPANTNDVWTAQEFGGCSAGCNPAFSSGPLWATVLGQFTFRDPHITQIIPAQGLATGGTVVDIFGSEFADGGTSVKFGNNFSPSVTWIDSTHIQAVSPTGSGTVDVTAMTGTGTSDTSPADQFTYIMIAATTTNLMSSANPSVTGQPVAYTASVSPAVDGGFVSFSDNGSPISGCDHQAVDLLGSDATCSVGGYADIGTHTIAATYSGTTNFSGSVSGSITQTVNPDATTTTVTPSVNPSAFGQSVTFGVTVTANAPGSGIPTGTVTFTEGSTTLDQETLLGGTAAYTTTTLAPGDHTITATYSGDINYLAGSDSVDQSVTCATTITSKSKSLVVGAGQCAVVTSGATISGGITVNPGGSLALDGVTVNGGIVANGAQTIRICNSTVNGGTVVANSSGYVLFGDAGDAGDDGTPSCHGNVQHGGVMITGSESQAEVGGNSISGGLTVSNSSGTGPTLENLVTEIEANTIKGGLTCLGNVPAPTNDGLPNSVTGSRVGQCASPGF
jgi:Bacterial Ig-like domain (group 3)/IPT/TIG domain